MRISMDNCGTVVRNGAYELNSGSWICLDKYLALRSLQPVSFCTSTRMASLTVLPVPWQSG